MTLTADNFKKGFLIDQELMGGVSENPESPGQFVAFVLRHSTGEYLGAQNFTALQDAINAINQVQRSWTYEKSAGCGSGNCGEGNCDKGNCTIKPVDCKTC